MRRVVQSFSGKRLFPQVRYVTLPHGPVSKSTPVVRANGRVAAKDSVISAKDDVIKILQQSLQENTKTWNNLENTNLGIYDLRDIVFRVVSELFDISNRVLPHVYQGKQLPTNKMKRERFLIEHAEEVLLADVHNALSAEQKKVLEAYLTFKLSVVELEREKRSQTSS